MLVPWAFWKRYFAAVGSIAGPTAVLEAGPLTVLLVLEDLIDVLLESYAAVPTEVERDLVINLTATAQRDLPVIVTTCRRWLNILG